jgi:hypothetical protein
VVAPVGPIRTNKEKEASALVGLITTAAPAAVLTAVNTVSNSVDKSEPSLWRGRDRWAADCWPTFSCRWQARPEPLPNLQAIDPSVWRTRLQRWTRSREARLQQLHQLVPCCDGAVPHRPSGRICRQSGVRHGPKAVYAVEATELPVTSQGEVVKKPTAVDSTKPTSTNSTGEEESGEGVPVGGGAGAAHGAAGVRHGARGASLCGVPCCL